jgi:hypothetical protein
MRANRIVVTPPALNDNLRFAHGVEDLAIEQLVAQARVEALDKAVLPRTARRDVSGLRPDSGDPFLHRLGDELRAVIGTNVLGNAAQDEQIRQDVDDVDRFEPARYPNGQALVRELVDDVEQAKFASVMGALLEEVIRPDVIGALGPQPDAGSVIQPQPGALGLSARDLQPLAPPDPLDPLVVDQPAGLAQQLGNLAIAVAAILPDQLDDVGGQPRFILTAPRDLALRRAMLTERGTGTPLGDRQCAANILDAGAATRGAQ